MKNCDLQEINPPETLPKETATPPPEGEPPPQKKRRRRWEVFPGANRFFCDGRFMVGRLGVLPLTLGLLLITSALFFIIDCPFLVEHLTSFIPAIGGVLFVFVLITLLQTTLTDPGILPRATPDEVADIERQIDDIGNLVYRPPPRIKEVLINQQVVKLKYCFTCRMFRPPRTSHCGLCDNCVERFDHHCPWVGNCVGKRNYRIFYTFIVSLSFLTVFIFGCVTTHLVLRAQGGNGMMFAVSESPGSAVELVICFLSVWSILGLTGFHTYLIAKNLTTNEDIKGSWSGKNEEGVEIENPYTHKNICKNCSSILCSPFPPSLIDRRGFMADDDPALNINRNTQIIEAKFEMTMCPQARKAVPGSVTLPVYKPPSFSKMRSHSVLTCSEVTLSEISDVQPVAVDTSRSLHTAESQPMTTPTLHTKSHSYASDATIHSSISPTSLNSDASLKSCTW